MDTTRRRRRTGTLAALLPGLTVLAVLGTASPGGSASEPVVQFTVTKDERPR